MGSLRMAAYARAFEMSFMLFLFAGHNPCPEVIAPGRSSNVPSTSGRWERVPARDRDSTRLKLERRFRGTVQTWSNKLIACVYAGRRGAIEPFEMPLQASVERAFSPRRRRVCGRLGAFQPPVALRIGAQRFGAENGLG